MTLGKKVCPPNLSMTSKFDASNYEGSTLKLEVKIMPSLSTAPIQGAVKGQSTSNSSHQTNIEEYRKRSLIVKEVTIWDPSEVESPEPLTLELDEIAEQFEFASDKAYVKKGKPPSKHDSKTRKLLKKSIAEYFRTVYDGHTSHDDTSHDSLSKSDNPIVLYYMKRELNQFDCAGDMQHGKEFNLTHTYTFIKAQGQVLTVALKYNDYDDKMVVRQVEEENLNFWIPPDYVELVKSITEVYKFKYKLHGKSKSSFVDSTKVKPMLIQSDTISDVCDDQILQFLRRSAERSAIHMQQHTLQQHTLLQQQHTPQQQQRDKK